MPPEMPVFHRFFFNSWRMPSLPEMPGALTSAGNGGAVWKPYGTSAVSDAAPVAARLVHFVAQASVHL